MARGEPPCHALKIDVPMGTLISGANRTSNQSSWPLAVLPWGWREVRGYLMVGLSSGPGSWRGLDY